MEIKKKSTNYQLKIANFYNFRIGSVKKLVPNFFDKEKYVLHHKSLPIYLMLGWKLKKYIVYYNSISHSG